MEGREEGREGKGKEEGKRGGVYVIGVRGDRRPCCPLATLTLV